MVAPVHVELVEYHEDAPDTIAVLFGKHGDIRINGQSVAVSREHPVKIEGGTFGEPVTVTLTLIVSSLHVRAEKPPKPADD